MGSAESKGIHARPSTAASDGVVMQGHTPTSRSKSGSVSAGSPSIIVVSYGAVLGPASQFQRVGRKQFEPLTLPASVDLRKTTCAPYFPAYAQGDTGACTAMVVAAAFACADRKQQSSPHTVPSALFNYYFARAITGEEDVDAGSSLKNALLSAERGIAPESAWPYVQNEEIRLTTKPPIVAQRTALSHTVRRAPEIVSDLRNLQRCLAHGYPFMFGFNVTQEMNQWFLDRELQIRSKFVLPSTASRIIVAAHAVLCVGYDDTRELLAPGASKTHGAFLIRNSWGKDWGEAGHFWMDYNVLANTSVARDFYYIQEVCDLETTCEPIRRNPNFSPQVYES